MVSVADGPRTPLAHPLHHPDPTNAQCRKRRLYRPLWPARFIRIRYFDQRDQRTTQDRTSASPIVEPGKPGLGPAISLSLFATPWASMAAHRCADSSSASSFVAFIRVDDLFSLRSTVVGALLDGRRR